MRGTPREVWTGRHRGATFVASPYHRINRWLSLWLHTHSGTYALVPDAPRFHRRRDVARAKDLCRDADRLPTDRTWLPWGPVIAGWMLKPTSVAWTTCRAVTGKTWWTQTGSQYLRPSRCVDKPSVPFKRVARQSLQRWKHDRRRRSGNSGTRLSTPDSWR